MFMSLPWQYTHDAHGVLQNVRVVQRNLVYAVGLAMEICYEDTLMGSEYFGAFGKMVKQMSLNRMGPYGSSVSRHGPTGSAYITFKRPEDAKRCIEAVNGAVWGGKLRCSLCTWAWRYCGTSMAADCIVDRMLMLQASR